MPTYNRDPFLPEAFESLRSQICTDWELIVVDDGSTDGTRTTIERLRHTIRQPVKYIHQENRGAYGARNTGLDHATSDLVAFYDSDDLWLPHHLSRCLDAFQRHPQLDWVFGACQRVEYATGRLLTPSSFFIDDTPRPFLSLRKQTSEGLHIIEDPETIACQLVHGLYAGLQNSVIRRTVFAHRRFVEKFRVSEDEFFLIRALADGARIAYYMEPHFIYRVHGDNSSASADGQSQEKRLAIFRELVDGFEQLSQEIAFTKRQRHALRRRLSQEYFWHLGYNGLWQAGRRRDALAAFRRGISLRPWHLPMWKTYLLAIVRLYGGELRSAH